MDRIKETLCTKCAHSDVCSYKKRYLDALRTVGVVLMEFDDVRVAPLELRCEFYFDKNLKEAANEENGNLLSVLKETRAYMEKNFKELRECIMQKGAM